MGPERGDLRRQTPFVGRQELGDLTAVLARARAGHGGLILVAGEAGVGKTRLCEEAVASSGLSMLRGAASERGTTPYGPLVVALRDHLRREPDSLRDSGPLAGHLGILLPELGAPPAGTDRETLAAAVTDALSAIARGCPTALMLDDLHWADAAILELLPSIATSAPEWPLAILCVYRSDEISRGHPIRRLRAELRRSGRLAEVAVGGLDPNAAARIASNVLGHELGRTLRAAVFDRTQGVAFFVEELAAALGASGVLVAVGATLEVAEGARMPIPATVRDAIRIRVEALSDAARGSLQAASVVGSTVPLEMLADLAEDGGVDEAFEAGLLVETDPAVAAFRHDLVREAVYADTPWPRRRALHRRLADLLQSRAAEPRLVADHLLAAGERARALPVLIDAARRFADVHAMRDAATAIRTALEIWPEGDDARGRLRALHELGRYAQRCGDLADAAAALEEAAAGLDPSRETRQRGEVKRDLGAVYELLGRVDRSVEARIDAGELFERRGLAAESAAVRLAAAQQVSSSDPPRALSLIGDALRNAWSAERADLEARCLSLHGLVLGLGGQRDEGTKSARAGLALAVSGGHLEAAVGAQWVLGTLANHWADYDGAESAFDAAVELCGSDGTNPTEQLCLSCLAIVAYNRGQWDRAEQIARDVLASSPRVDVEAHAVLVLGLISAARGATKRARSLLDKALAVARSRELGSTLCQANAALALVDELEGVSSPRWRELIETPPTVLRQNYGWWLCRAATAAARRGDVALVRQCANVMPTWAAHFSGVEGLAALAHVLGEVMLAEGDARGATEHFGRALELLAGIGAPLEVAHTQMRAGAALAGTGARQAGVDVLVEGYRTFRQLGARPFWLQAAADLEALGEQVDRRLGRRAAHDLAHGGLTRRELEILRLVAVGRTNREIASDLFVSPRTVDMHVRHVLTKLGCRTRTEATSRAHDLGLLVRDG